MSSHKKRRPDSRAAYAGYAPHNGAPIERVDAATSAAKFFCFVSARQPVVIAGLPADEAFHAEQWQPSQLVRHCARSTPFIESRSAATGTFGTGLKQRMRFDKFAAALRTESLYLTTQPMDEDDTGLPKFLYASPIVEMRQHLPLKPAIAGNLVLSSVNLWVGSSASGTSSNLHHDHHDNVYVLLRGRKRFTLFPPSAAFCMYLHGPLTHVHANGLLNYAGCATREDGAMPHLVLERLHSLLAKAKAAAAKAKAAGAGKSGGGKSRADPVRLRDSIAAAEREVAAACARDPEYAAAIAADGCSESSPGSDSDDGDRFSDGDGSEVSDGGFAAELRDDYDYDDTDVGASHRLPASSRSKPATGAKSSGRGSSSAEADDMWAALSKLPLPAAGAGSGKVGGGSDRAAASDKGTRGGKSSGAEADAMWAALAASAAAMPKPAGKRGTAAAELEADRSSSDRVSSSNSCGKGSSAVAGTLAEDPGSIPFHFSRVPLPALRGKLLLHTAPAGSGSAAAAASVSAAAVGSKRPRPDAAAAASTPGNGAGEVDAMRALPEVRRDFPLFADTATAPAYTVELRAGQCLYLPAGWFHEVVSFNDEKGGREAVGADSAAPGVGEAAAVAGLSRAHIALNYWFYPPASTGTFAQPYADGYWEGVYSRMAARTPGALPGRSAAVSSTSRSGAAGARASMSRKPIS
jgi:mannose-6-phosphate isomerase-like protein (cupin superfamily)